MSKTPNGECLRQIMFMGAIEWFLDTLLTQLPKDVRIIDHDGTIIRIMPVYDDMGRCVHIDRSYILFGSNDWPPTEDGEVIPRFGFCC